MQTILVPMEELAMLKLDGTLVYVLLVTKEQTAKLVSKTWRATTQCSNYSNIS